MQRVPIANTPAIVMLVSLVFIGNACSPKVTEAPTSSAQATGAAVAPSPSASAVAVATVEPTIAACLPNPSDTGPALAGIVELRPEGWTMRSNGVGIPGFPDVQWSVYGPPGPELLRREGAGRLVLYETWSPNDAYVQSRIAASKKAGGFGVAATVCGDRTELWTKPSTGELLVGWTYRGKSDVLVANQADYSAEELVQSAERVYDCCG